MTDTRSLVNCGAVGQPRDGDPRAAFGILDTADRTFSLVQRTVRRRDRPGEDLAAGLPEVLAQRLGVGR